MEINELYGNQLFETMRSYNSDSLPPRNTNATEGRFAYALEDVPSWSSPTSGGPSNLDFTSMTLKEKDDAVNYLYSKEVLRCITIQF